MKWLRDGRWAWLLLALAAAAIYPALVWNSGAVAYDAALQHIPRGLIFSNAIDDGVLFPRWVQFLHLGLGSPLFTFQGPLPYYFMDGLFRLGIPHPLGWRFLIAAGLLAACVGMYLFVHALTGHKWPSVLAAVAFLYAPYVLRNSLERGSNEAYSMFLYPWVIWALLWMAQRPSFARFTVATLLWAGCIASHVLGPLMLAPVALLVAAVAAWRHRTASPLLALLAGGLLTAFIWAPMIPEQSYVHVERDFSHPDAKPWDNPIALSELLAPPVVFDVERENNQSGNRVGLLQSALLVLALPAALAARMADRRHRTLALCVAAASLLGLLLLWSFTDAANAAWRVLAPIVGRVQYRSRLMGLQALAAATAAGLAVALSPPRWQRRLALALAGLLIAAALPSLYINLRHEYAPIDANITRDQVRDIEIKTGGSALTAYSEFLPRWRTAPFDDALLAELGTRFDPPQGAHPLAQPPEGVLVTSARVRSSAWDVTVASPVSATLTFHLLYYPRWQAYLDGQPIAARPQAETGYLQLDFPAGTHALAFRYGMTAAERAGLAVSALTLGALALLGVLAALRKPGRQIVDRPFQLTNVPSYQLSNVPIWLLLALTGLLAFKVFYVDGATLWLRCQSTPGRVCGAEGSPDIPFDGGMRLRGYSAPREVVRGEALPVRLFWQADHPIDRGLYAFVHIRNSQPDGPTNPESGNDIWAQVEVEGPGGFFTTGYLPGRIYADEQRIPIPKGMPPGEYLLEVGWYDPATGEQLEPDAASVKPPLKMLWRSVLLPSIRVK